MNPCNEDLLRNVYIVKTSSGEKVPMSSKPKDHITLCCDIEQLIEEALQDMERECPRNRLLSDYRTNIYNSAHYEVNKRLKQMGVTDDILADYMYARTITLVSEKMQNKITKVLLSYGKNRRILNG
ncbi:hypothetical protein [Lactobacillus phage Lbab1]|nr:hypothetical protein [Lactobacillus phage Lbab1]